MAPYLHVIVACFCALVKSFVETFVETFETFPVAIPSKLATRN